MRGSPVRTTEETSNEHIASASVTKDIGESVSVLGRAAATEYGNSKGNVGRTAATNVWKR